MIPSCTGRLCLLAVVVGLCLSLNVVWAWDGVVNDEPVRRAPRLERRGHRGTLDDPFTQLLYIKTEDYGATWTAVTQAGDLAALTEIDYSLPDFSAVCTEDDELCYAVYLETAPTPGVYAFTGPTFAPVLVMAEGNNMFSVGNNGGWTDIGRTPSGDLFILIWGWNSTFENTLWVSKSTTDGLTWGTPYVVATTPQLPTGNLYPHLSQMNSDTLCFGLLQDSNFTQYFLRFPVAGGTGTVTNTGLAAGTEFSYYTGNCMPIAYDPENNALVYCFRNATLSGTTVRYSGNQGVSWDTQSIVGAQRYPSIAVNAEQMIPWVFSNYGVPATGQQHWAWFAKDEGGYGGGLWTDPINYASVTYDGTVGLLYMNQGYWWDDDHGVSIHNYWGVYTPEGLYTSRTENGGTIWTGFSPRFMYDDNNILPASLSNCELVGGADGVAYVVFCGAIGELAPQNFVPVSPTDSSYQIVVDSALFDGELMEYYDEIGVFDGDLCVGAAVVTAFPLTVTAWQGDTVNNIPGFVPGDSIHYRLWSIWRDQEVMAAATYTTGNGTFGNDSLARCALVSVMGPPEINLPVSVFDYGRVALGRSRYWSVEIQNLGESSLHISQVTSSNPRFVLINSSWFIPGGSTDHMPVRFVPVDTLLETGAITIYSDDADEPVITVSVQGQGIARQPLPFNLVSPLDGAEQDSLNVRLRWRRTIDPDTAMVFYNVWLDTLPDLSTRWRVANLIADSIRVVSNLRDEHTFYWTVHAADSNTAGTWASDTFSFSVSYPNPPGVFQLVAPADGDSVLELPTFIWRRAIDPDLNADTRYQVWADTLPDFSTSWQAVPTLSDTTIVPLWLPRNNAIYWTVLATDNNTPGRWSPDTLVFYYDMEIKADEPEPGLPTVFYLAQNYPNPFNPATEIEFGLPQTAPVRLSIFNVLGQELALLVNETLPAGVHRRTFDAARFPAGIYFYRMEAGTFTDIRKMMLLK